MRKSNPKTFTDKLRGSAKKAINSGIFSEPQKMPPKVKPSYGSSAPDSLRAAAVAVPQKKKTGGW